MSEFGSFLLPLVILVPAPLTLIGIVIGHWLFNAAFTATSMIGFIALAGIIVRNSILLVDFIRHKRAEGDVPLRQALIEAGATAVQADRPDGGGGDDRGGLFLTDPIFRASRSRSSSASLRPRR